MAKKKSEPVAEVLAEGLAENTSPEPQQDTPPSGNVSTPEAVSVDQNLPESTLESEPVADVEPEHKKATIDGFYVVSCGVDCECGDLVIASDSQEDALKIAAEIFAIKIGKDYDIKNAEITDYVGRVQSIDKAYFAQDGVLQYGAIHWTSQYKRYMEAVRSRASAKSNA